MANGIQLSADILAIARRLGLSPDTVHYCLDVELIRQPLTELELAELRRVHRLLDLEVNLAGLEIILRMRKQMCAMQAQLETMAAEMAAAQSRFESQIRELERRLAQDL
jgi:DNA-binding transcriptional MerR regulator